MRDKLDLSTPGVPELIAVANMQFQIWARVTRANSLIDMPPGINMELWTIMSRLATKRDQDFSMLKTEMYSCIPSLGTESVRKYVAFASRCGFVESYRGTGPLRLRLTEIGKKVILDVISNWASEFGRVHNEYFKIDNLKSEITP